MGMRNTKMMTLCSHSLTIYNIWRLLIESSIVYSINGAFSVWEIAHVANFHVNWSCKFIFRKYGWILGGWTPFPAVLTLQCWCQLRCLFVIFFVVTRFDCISFCLSPSLLRSLFTLHWYCRWWWPEKQSITHDAASNTHTDTYMYEKW